MTTFIEGRKLRVTLVSANNLPKVRKMGRMKVYAEVSLNGNPGTAKKSEADMEGETNPTWNFVSVYTISEPVIQHPGVNLVVKLSCKRTLGDRLIGEVKIPVKNLFDMASKSVKTMRYDVEGTPEGVLNVSYGFGRKMAVSDPARAPAPARRQSSSTGRDVLITMVGLGLTLFGVSADGLLDTGAEYDQGDGGAEYDQGDEGLEFDQGDEGAEFDQGDGTEECDQGYEEF